MKDKAGWAAGGRAGKPHILLGTAILLAAALCFGLGILVARDMPRTDDALWIEQLPPEELPGSVPAESAAGKQEEISGPAGPQPGGGPAAADAAASAAAHASTGTYVASKNGTRYYLPSCSGAKRIKEENRVWFQTKSMAEAAGYTPAANCDGM